MTAWRLFTGFLALLGAAWLVLGNVIAVEAICCEHWTVIGKAAVISLMAILDCGAIAFIAFGPLADARES